MQSRGALIALQLRRSAGRREEAFAELERLSPILIPSTKGTAIVFASSSRSSWKGAAMRSKPTPLPSTRSAEPPTFDPGTRPDRAHRGHAPSRVAVRYYETTGRITACASIFQRVDMSLYSPGVLRSAKSAEADQVPRPRATAASPNRATNVAGFCFGPLAANRFGQIAAISIGIVAGLALGGLTLVDYLRRNRYLRTSPASRSTWIGRR